jgi:hypothetical protein
MPGISELYVGGTAVNPDGSNINPVALAQDMVRANIPRGSRTYSESMLVALATANAR